MTAFVAYPARAHHGNRGFTLIELLVVVAIIGIIAAIAMPGLLRARIAGNEASAVASIRAINTAEKVYSQQCSAGGAAYAVSLVTLGTGVPPFISSELTQSNPSAKSGYTFQLGPGAGANPVVAPSCPGAQTAFYLTAVPNTVGSTGIRGFASSSRDSIWQDSTGAAPGEPFASAGTVSPLQ